MAVKLIIFDLDGTLIDSVGDINEALNCALEPSGVERFLPSEVVGMVGEGALRLIEKALEKRNVDYEAEQFMNRFAAYYTAHLVDHTIIYPGVVETLAMLKGYRKAMVSNKFESVTRRILDALDLAHYFEMIVCADTMPERKPSPEPILHVLARLGVDSTEAVIVGDSEIDIQAGKAALVKTIAVTYGYGGTGFQEEADFVIDQFPYLIDVLKSLQ